MKYMKKRTKVSAHLISSISGVLSEGENITVAGRIMYYDDYKKTWKPIGGLLKIMLNDKEIRKIKSDKSGFKFSIRVPSEGKHKLEIRFIGDEEHEPYCKVLRFQVLNKNYKKMLMKFLSVAYFFMGITYLALFLTLVLMILFI